jgi:hypothetical protein
VGWCVSGDVEEGLCLKRHLEFGGALAGEHVRLNYVQDVDRSAAGADEWRRDGAPGRGGSPNWRSSKGSLNRR